MLLLKIGPLFFVKNAFSMGLCSNYEYLNRYQINIPPHIKIQEYRFQIVDTIYFSLCLLWLQSDPLWSSKALEEHPDAIKNVSLRYLRKSTLCRSVWYELITLNVYPHIYLPIYGCSYHQVEGQIPPTILD